MIMKKFFVLTAALCCIASVTCADIDSGLYGYWTLDGNLNDSSGNGHTLSGVGGSGGSPVPNESGRFDGCYQFANSAGSAQIMINGTISYAATDSLSVSAWVNPSVLVAGFTTTSPHTIVKFYSSTVGTTSFDIRIRDSKLDVYYTNPGANNLTSFVIPTNEWTFVSVVQSGTLLTVYVNDQKQSFVVNGGQAYNRIMMGATGGTNPRGLTGLLDEIRLYKRALTDSDVQELYEYDPAAFDITSALYGYWALDGDFTDSSGNGINMVAVGTAPIANANGHIDGCYEFNNAAAYSMLAATSPVIDHNDVLTVTGWINPSVLVDGFTTTSPHTLVRMYETPGTAVMDFRIRDKKLDLYYTNPSANISSGLVVPTNQWTFIAMIQNKTSVRFYLNDQTSAAFTVAGGQNYNRIVLGCAPGSQRGLTGLLDDVRVYKRALSTADLQALYNYTSPQPDVATDLYAYWHLDGDLSDSGPNGIALNVTPEFGDPNEVTAAADGHLGACYQFDNATKGIQVLTSMNSMNITAANGVTATAWVKPSLLINGFTNTSPHNIVYLTYFDGENYINALVLRIHDGKIAAHYSYPASNNVTAFAIPLNEWSFVAVTQFNKTLTVYFNDQKQSFTVSGAMDYTDVRIGGQQSLPRGMNGLLDEVRLYDRALSPIDIEAIYNQQYREADINRDGIVGFGDFAIMSDNWFAETQAGSFGDINCDGIVNDDDLSLMAKYWLETTAVN